MYTETETNTANERKQLAAQVRQALLEEMRKAVAEKNWTKLNSIVWLMQGSNPNPAS